MNDQSRLRLRSARVPALVVGVLAALCLLALESQAFRILKNSVTKQELRWSDGVNQLTRNSCSINSDAELDLYFDTIARWNEIGGLRSMFEAKFRDNSNICVVRKGNSRNQVAIVDRDEIDGAAGLSKKLYFGKNLTEDDVFIAQDMGTLGPSDPGFFGRVGASAGGRNVLLHEFGHSIGLDHDDSQHAIMRSFVVLSALAGFDEFASIYPDDIAGARKHYSGGASEINFIPSWQILYDNLPEGYRERYDILFGPPPGEAFCAGQRLLSYNRTAQIVDEDDGDCDSGGRLWRLFNPSPGVCSDADTMEACEDLGPDGPAATTGVEGVTEDNAEGFRNRVLEVCPGDRIRVPWTVVQRRSTFDPAAHRTAFLAGPLDAEEDEIVRTFFDGIVEVDHEADGDLVSGVQEIELVSDVDCWDETEEYAVYVEADHCDDINEIREDDSSGEDDNRIRTDVRFRVLSLAECGLVAGDDMCGEVFVEDCGGGGGGDAPPGYALCENEGIEAGFCAGGPCAPVNRLGNNENATLDWQSDWFADGDHAFDQYCDNFTADGEMVCNDDDGFGVCERCGIDTMTGCRCDSEDDCDNFDIGLGCFGEDFGRGFCWDENEGSPVFHCEEGDCSNIGDRFQNAPYYCSQEIDEIPEATCIPFNCSRPQALPCAGQDLICNAAGDACANQCLEDDACVNYPPGYGCSPDLLCEFGG